MQAPGLAIVAFPDGASDFVGLPYDVKRKSIVDDIEKNQIAPEAEFPVFGDPGWVPDDHGEGKKADREDQALPAATENSNARLLHSFH